MTVLQSEGEAIVAFIHRNPKSVHPFPAGSLQAPSHGRRSATPNSLSLSDPRTVPKFS